MPLPTNKEISRLYDSAGLNQSMEDNIKLNDMMDILPSRTEAAPSPLPEKAHDKILCKTLHHFTSKANLDSIKKDGAVKPSHPKSKLYDGVIATDPRLDFIKGIWFTLDPSGELCSKSTVYPFNSNEPTSITLPIDVKEILEHEVNNSVADWIFTVNEMQIHKVSDSDTNAELRGKNKYRQVNYVISSFESPPGKALKKVLESEEYQKSLNYFVVGSGPFRRLLWEYSDEHLYVSPDFSGLYVKPPRESGTIVNVCFVLNAPIPIKLFKQPFLEVERKSITNETEDKEVKYLTGRLGVLRVREPAAGA